MTTELHTRALSSKTKGKTISELTAALEQSRSKFQIFLKAINDAVWDWNIRDGSVEWNHGLFEIYGHDPAKAPHNYKAWANNVHPEDKEEVLKELHETFSHSKTQWTSIYRYKCGNGNYKYTYDRGHVIYENAQAVRMVGAMHDIDDRMTALREVEKLSLVASKTDNLVVITDANENIEWVNESFTKKTGYAISEVIGRTLAFLHGPETAMEALLNIWNGIRNRVPVTEEILNYAKDGSPFWTKNNINPVFDENGNLVRFVIVQTDITLQKDYEQEITAIALDLTNLIATVSAPVFGLDKNGCINAWNNRAAELTGYSKEEAWQRTFVDEFVPAQSRAQAMQNLQRVYRGEALSNLELPLITKDERNIYILLSATPAKKTGNEVETVFLVGQDFTEFTLYRNALEEKVKERTAELQAALAKEKELVNMKSRFASVVSHEFRTPLSTISVSANYIKRFYDQIGREDVTRKIDGILEQIKHMNELLEDVLTIGKTESGRMEVKKRAVDVCRLIHAIKDDVENQFNHSHRVDCDLALSTPEIWIDDGFLRNIFVNLLSNAVKFSPGQETVYINGREENGFAVFQVIDQGIGIPPDDLERIFSPFDRGTNTGAIAGTGLGLSIVKKALDLIGGSITVQSTPGKGSVFSVKIPLT